MKYINLIVIIALLLGHVMAVPLVRTDEINTTQNWNSQLHGVQNGTAAQDVVTYSQLHNSTSGMYTVGNNDSSADFNTADYTNDSDCFAAALVKGSIYIKSGSYISSWPSEIPSNRVVEISPGAIIKNTCTNLGAYDPGGALSINLRYYNAIFINSDRANGNKNITIRGGILDGNGAGPGDMAHGIQFLGVIDGLVEDVNIYGCNGDGICISHAGLAGAEIGSNGITVRDCTIENLIGVSRNGISVLWGNNTTFINNRIRGIRSGICWEGEHTHNGIAAQNSISDFSSYGIQAEMAEGVGYSISDIEIANNLVGPSSYPANLVVGIRFYVVNHIYGMAGNSVISNNVINGVEGSTVYGIQVKNTDTCVLVAGNMIHDVYATVGISVQNSICPVVHGNLINLTGGSDTENLGNTNPVFTDNW